MPKTHAPSHGAGQTRPVNSIKKKNYLLSTLLFYKNTKIIKLKMSLIVLTWEIVGL